MYMLGGTGRCGPECAEKHDGLDVSPEHLSAGHPDAEAVQKCACDKHDGERLKDRVEGVRPAAHAAARRAERALRLAAPIVGLPAAVVVALAHRGHRSGIRANVRKAYSTVVAQAESTLQCKKR